jgi:hypothetical protein
LGRADWACADAALAGDGGSRGRVRGLGGLLSQSLGRCGKYRNANGLRAKEGIENDDEC